MSLSMDDLDKVTTAKVFATGNGQYVKPGFKYRHVVAKIEGHVTRAQGGGVGKPMVFITLIPKAAERIDFEKSADGKFRWAEHSPIGAECSVGYDLSMDAGPGNLKKFFLALLDATSEEFEAMQEVTAEAAAEIKAIEATPELQRTQLQLNRLKELSPKKEGTAIMFYACGKDNPFKGREIEDVAYNKPTRATETSPSKDFTRHEWTYVPGQSAETVAGNASTLATSEASKETPSAE